MSIQHDRTAWLQGGDARCVQPPQNVCRIWRVVLLGAPGSGKGTQAQLLHHALGACPLSTGDVFRAAAAPAGRRGSALALAHASLARGELVPDRIVLDLIRERGHCLHCRGGFMFDGFPRTLAQAQALDDLLDAENLSLDVVIYFATSPGSLFARLAGRRICPRCHEVYHLEARRPRIVGVCDHCGAGLEQRLDDRPEVIAARLRAYTKMTKPLLAYYRRKGLLVTVQAKGTPSDILARTLDALVEHEALV